MFQTAVKRVLRVNERPSLWTADRCSAESLINLYSVSLALLAIIWMNVYLFLCDWVVEECWMKAEQTGKKWLKVSSALPSLQTKWWRCDREQVRWVVDLLRADSINLLLSSATRERMLSVWLVDKQRHTLHTPQQTMFYQFYVQITITYKINSVNTDRPFTDIDIMMHVQLQKSFKCQNVLFISQLVLHFSAYRGISKLFTIPLHF